MSGISSPRIRGKHNLDRYIRDSFAIFSIKTHIPEKMTTEDVHKRSTVNITYKKEMGHHKDTGYRYYYYKANIQRKPSVPFTTGHPVIMERPKNRRWP